jgi:NADP-dependent 3-hydroxy acid dehydrogenase YdfG
LTYTTLTYLSVYPAIDPAPLFASQPYKGKVVLITGASRGIGQETAIQYARAGASVALVARTEDSLEGTTHAIISTAPGAEVLALAADVREANAAEASVRRVLERFGKLDVLIANAGSIAVLGRSKGYGLYAHYIN